MVLEEFLKNIPINLQDVMIKCEKIEIDKQNFIEFSKYLDHEILKLIPRKNYIVLVVSNEKVKK